jgi:hypothetical protein
MKLEDVLDVAIVAEAGEGTIKASRMVDTLVHSVPPASFELAQILE